jgi:hypothetical protein
VTESRDSQPVITPSEKAVVLSTLEQDQLALQKHHIPRRQLKGFEIFILWALRIYLLFMIGVVLYQIWSVRS